MANNVRSSIDAGEYKDFNLAKRGVLSLAQAHGARPTGFRFAPTVDSETGEFSANLQITSAAADAIQSIDQVGEIVLPVTVASQNYNDATINVVVMPTARSEKTVTIEGVPDSKTYGDADFTLTATVDDEGAKASDWYWYSSDPNVLEVANTGSNTMSITVKSPGSAQIMAWYEPEYESGYSGPQYIGAALTESITVNKAEFTPAVAITGWTYGAYNEQANAPSVSGIPEGASKEIQENNALKVTYEYKAKDAVDSTYTAIVPTLAGTYTVRATVPETTNYKSAACTADFTIAKKEIIATVTAADKTYDGTTDATVSATVNEGDLVQSDLDDSALVEGGKVAVSGLVGAFADKIAGENIEIDLDYDNVVSPVANAECYDVKIAEKPKASIAPRAVNVGAADKSSPYGQDIAELDYGLYGPNGLVEGDTLASLGVTASTTATSSSPVGEYPITLSGGTANRNYAVTLGEGATYTISAADISKAKVELAATAYTYDGKAKIPAVKSVALGGKALKAGTDYTVAYKDNKNAGSKATATVTGTGNYADKATAKFTIKKATNALTVKKATKSVKASKRAQTVKCFTKAKPKFKAGVSYKKATTAKAKKLNGYKVLSVNGKTGEITVKAGAKPGTYRLMVTVTAAKTANTNAASKTVTVTVKVAKSLKAQSAKAVKSLKAQSASLVAAAL